MYLAIGVAGTWCPGWIDAEPLTIPNANSFLSTVWQVEAAALGLTVTVALFSFQSVSASRWPMDLREFARRTQLEPVIWLGSASLLVNGIVLTDHGRGGPDGWAGTWATVLAAVTLLSVPVLFRSVMHAIDPRQLRQATLDRLKSHMQASVDNQIEIVLGMGLQRDWTSDLNVRFNPYAQPQIWHHAVPAPRSGQLTDIRFRKLRKLQGRFPGIGRDAGIHLLTPFRGHVNKESTLLLLPRRATDDDVQLAVKAVRIRPANTEELDGPMGLLHDAAVAAARRGEVGWYREIAKAHIDALLELPRQWAQHGEKLTSELLYSAFQFRHAEVDGISDSIREQLRQAVAERQIEITELACSIPVEVARQSVPLSAHGLSNAMVSLIARLVWATDGDTDIDKAVRAQLIGGLVSYTEVVVGTRISDTTLDIEARLDAAEFLDEAYSRLAELSRHLIDQRRPDQLSELLRRWAAILRDWDPDDGEAHLNLSLAAKGIDPNRPNIVEAQAQVDAVERMETVKDSIHAAFRRSVFALAAWSIHSATDEHTEPMLTTLRDLAGWIGNDTDRFRAAEDALRTDKIGQWVRWSVPGNISHGTDSLVLRTLVIVTTMAASPTADVVLEPTPWMAERRAGLIATIDDSAPTHTGTSSCPTVSSPSDSTDSPKASTPRQTTKRRPNASHSSAHPSTPRSSTHSRPKPRVRTEARVSALSCSDTTPKTRAPTKGDSEMRIGGRMAAFKSWFTRESDTDRARYATHVGEQLADSADLALILILAAAPTRRLPAGTLREKVATAKTKLRDDGYTPNVMLVGNNHKARRELDISKIDGKDPRLAGLLTRARQSVLGETDGMLVIRRPEIDDNTIVIADAPAAARYHPIVTGDDNDYPSITIHTYGQAEAMAAVRKNKALARTDRATTLAAHAGQLRTNVGIDTFIGLDFELENPKAAIRIRITGDLAKR